MRRVALASAALAVLTTACQPSAGPLSEEDVASIRSLGAAYAAANLAKDADAVAAVYAEDAIEMPPNEPATMGRSAIRDRYAQGLELGGETLEFTVSSVEIDGSEGLAFDRGTWTWTGTPPGMTEPITESGKHISIARRQEDGSWLWTAVIWNSDTPLPQSE
jgi:uncharacterized protein (TIGR02246 family)